MSVSAQDVYGPYRAQVAEGGPGLRKKVSKDSSLLGATAPWTIMLWVQGNGTDTLIAGVGEPTALDSRFLGVKGGRAVLRLGEGQDVMGLSPMPRNGWHLLAATAEGGLVRLYVDGKEAASGSGFALGKVEPIVLLAPTDLPAGFTHFAGEIAQFTVLGKTLSAKQVTERFDAKPDLTTNPVEVASGPWPLQVKAQAGMSAPQDEESVPHSREALGRGVALPLPRPGPTLHGVGEGRWTLAANWELAFAKDLRSSGTEVSRFGAAMGSKPWMPATVPGTVLTTLVDRGVYPDPDFGLNNLAIPESLNKEAYWYRVAFPTPKGTTGRRAELLFNGINYAAEVWLNGVQLGSMKGAFVRGTFDATPMLAKDGWNELAVHIMPPPHPGIPQEQSMKGGPGPNGGILCLDGPTFVATEGWDWIPAVRDRNTGIWQDVELRLTNALTLGDAKVVTRLPLPDTTHAVVEIAVPVSNASAKPLRAEVRAMFEGVEVAKAVLVAPGSSVVLFEPKEFAALQLTSPRLWWPNGYGKPELYHLQLSVTEGGDRLRSQGAELRHSRGLV